MRLTVKGKSYKVPVMRELTEKQSAVLRLVGDGLTVEEIAEKLEMNPRTVRSHVDNLRHKFRVDKKRELIAVAREQFG